MKPLTSIDLEDIISNATEDQNVSARIEIACALHPEEGVKAFYQNDIISFECTVCGRKPAELFVSPTPLSDNSPLH